MLSKELLRRRDAEETPKATEVPLVDQLQMTVPLREAETTALVVDPVVEVGLKATERPASEIAPAPVVTSVIDLEVDDGPSTEPLMDVGGPSGQALATIPQARLDLLLTEVRGLFAINEALLRKEQEKKAAQEQAVSALKEQLAKAQGAVQEKDNLLQLQSMEMETAQENLRVQRAETLLLRENFNTERSALQLSLGEATATKEGAEKETASLRAELANALESLSAKDVRIASLRRQVSLVAEKANKTVKKIRISNYICGYVDRSDDTPMKHSFEDLQRATEEAEAAEEADESDSSDEDTDEDVPAPGLDVLKECGGASNEVGAGVFVVITETADMATDAGAVNSRDNDPAVEPMPTEDISQKDETCNPTSGANTEKV